MEELNWGDRPVTALPGVGRVKAGHFGKLGIQTIADLLYHFPRGYQNRGAVCLLGEASMTPCSTSTILTVDSKPSSVRLKGNRVMTRFTAFDDSGKCIITFFNQPYVKDIFFLGSSFRFWGKVEKLGRNFTLSCPEYEPFDGVHPLPEFKSVYPLTEGLNQKGVGSAVALALQDADKIKDPLPPEVLQSYCLLPLGEAFRKIHFPQNYEELDEARRRFVFEELFFYALGMQKIGKKEALPPKEVLSKADLSPFLSLLPFSLTNAQKKVLEDVSKDMTGPFPMTRLICGDVGSGKTACAAGAIYIALQNQRQAALMVPTEILAHQHFAELAPIFERLGFSTALLIGSLSPAQKKKVRLQLEKGQVQLVIGTQALLTESTVFRNLGLVIADEQHRFGVNQRAGLSGKGKAVHTLVMTATPIPRTLALILYNGLDISYIDEMPPGRKSVGTYLVNESYRTRLMGFIEKQAKEGHQTYVVCPAVETEEPEEEEGENGQFISLSYHPEEEHHKPLSLKAAVQFSEELQKAMPSLRVGFVHGKMKPKEKEEVMAAFARNEIQVLVSTTVIEVGVNVPNATLMVVENAERFGLSQLHQLRGRVGRGNAQSYCVLVSESNRESAAGQRLSALCKTQKGLEIANEDLKMRGPGDFFPSASGTATRQSGEFSFKVASLCTDPTMPEKAAMAAKALLADDPELAKEEHSATLHRMLRLFTLTQNSLN